MEASTLATTKSPSPVATISGALGCASVAFFVLGPISIQLGITSPFIGFRIFTLGILLALLALVLGAVALWLTRSASGRSGFRLDTFPRTASRSGWSDVPLLPDWGRSVRTPAARA